MKELVDKIRSLLSEKLTLYPILTGILFLLDELRKNAMYYTIKEIVSLVFIILTFTFLVDLFVNKFIKNRNKAALIATLIIIINLFYVDLFNPIAANHVLLNFIRLISFHSPGVVIFLLLVLACLGLSLAVLYAKPISQKMNFYFNLLSIAFILVEVIKWGSVVQYPQIKLVEPHPFLVNTSLQAEQKPDIYYIILDSYTSSESLKKYWKYNNSAFENSLTKLGFFIAKKSKTNYISTPCCMASYLNSSMLLLDSSIKYNYWNMNFIQLIRKNRLYDWLSANGYKCYNFSMFDTFGKVKYLKGYFVNHFLSRTIWYAVSNKLYHFLKPSSQIPQINLSIFNEINYLATKKHEKPLFVYAHVYMPHSPFFFDKNGNSLVLSDSISDKQAYLGQLLFANTLTLKSINNILQSSPNRVMIIIQGDHGYRSLDDTTLLERSNEAHTIFNAIYTPNQLTLSDSLNPTDTFNKLVKEINGF